MTQAYDYDNIDFEPDVESSEVSPLATDYDDFITEAATKYEVEPELIKAIISVESGGDPGAVSQKNAQGLMQLLPKTAKAMGVKDISDPKQNIMGGTKYISKQLAETGGDKMLALARYNAGPSNVKKHGGIPPFKETKDYIQKVAAEYEKLTGTSFDSKTKKAEFDFDNINFESDVESSTPETEDVFDFESDAPIKFPSVQKKAEVPELGVDLAPSDMAPEESNLLGLFGKMLESPKAKVIDEVDQIIKTQAPPKEIGEKPEFLEPVGEPAMLGEVLSVPFKPGGFVANLPGQVTEADLAQSQFQEEGSPAVLGGELLGTTAEFFHNLPGPKKVVYKTGELKPGEVGRQIGKIMTQTGFEIAGASSIFKALGVGYDTVVNSDLWKTIGKSFGKFEQRVGLQTAADLASEMKASGASDAEILKALRKYVGKDRQKVFKQYFEKARAETREAAEVQTREFFKKEAERAKNSVLKGDRKLIEAPKPKEEVVPGAPAEVAKTGEKIGAKPPEVKTELGKEVKAELSEKKKPSSLAQLKEKEKQIAELPKPPETKISDEVEKIADKVRTFDPKAGESLTTTAFNLGRDINRGKVKRADVEAARKLIDKEANAQKGNMSIYATLKQNNQMLGEALELDDILNGSTEYPGKIDMILKYSKDKFNKKEIEILELAQKAAKEGIGPKPPEVEVPKYPEKETKDLRIVFGDYLDTLTLAEREAVLKQIQEKELFSKESGRKITARLVLDQAHDAVKEAKRKAPDAEILKIRKQNFKDKYGHTDNPLSPKLEIKKPPKRILKELSYTSYKGDQALTAKTYLEYKGMKIAKQYKGLYNIVDKDGKTVGQYAGINGATEAIDTGKYGGVVPEKVKVVPKAGENVRTLRGFVKHIGKINPLNYKGEVKELPKVAQFLFKKSGIAIDDVVNQLIGEGFLSKDATVASFLEDLRINPDLLKQDRIYTGQEVEKPEAELTEKEKQFKKDEAFQAEEPPEGDYVSMLASDLPEGKKLTIIESKTAHGWDIYEVKESEPFGPVKLVDGQEVELKPGDRVQVLKSDLKIPAKEKVEVISPDGKYVDWSEVKTRKQADIEQKYYGVHNKDKSFLGWKTKSEVDRIKSAKGKKVITLDQGVYGQQRPSGLKGAKRGEQAGLGLEGEEKAGDLFTGKSGTVLYSGIPIHELVYVSKSLARVYEKFVGEPLWKFLSETIPEGAGKRSKIVDLINKGIILDYRKDPRFIKLRDDTYKEIELARKRAKDLADTLNKLPRAEQVRVSQIIQGSITNLPERYKEAYEVVEKFKYLEKQLQRLGILGEDNIFRQLTRKELANKYKEVKALDEKVAQYRKRLDPIIRRGKVIQRSSESTFEEVKNTVVKTKTGKYKTDATKWTKLNEDRVREALTSRGFSIGEADQMIERVKQSVVEIGTAEYGTLKEIQTTIEKVVTKTITTEVERIKTFSRSYMARAKAAILKDIKETIKKRNDVMGRITTHYKMSGKQYLRRAYTAIETEENFLSKLMGYAAKRPRLKKGYNIQRKDLDYLYRTYLGEIKEAPFLVYKGLSEEYHDMFMMDMFNRIAENKKWAVSPKEWDNIMKIKARADKVAHYKDFKPLPMTDRLGNLSGAMVDPYIWDDLNQAVHIVSEIGKAFDKLLNLWKIGKVPFNPATQFRNILSNTILADFAGLSPLRIDIYARAARDLLTKSGYWDEVHKTTVLFGKEWIGGEVEEFLKNVSEFRDGNFASKVIGSLKFLANKPLQVYQGIEQFFKLAVYTYHREAGLGIDEAAKLSEEAIFNYQKIPPAIRWAKRWYSPFITFCLSEDTEILTNNGWKAYGDINNNDITLGYDVNTKELFWQPIEKINVFNYFGDMYHIKSRSLDILMTPEHRNVVERNYYRGPRKNQKKIPYETIIEAQDLKPEDCIIVAGKYSGAPKEKTISDDIVRLVGWLVTDGFIVSQGNEFKIGQTNPKGQIEIEKLRVRLGINNYNVQKRQFKNGTGIDKTYYIPAYIRNKVVIHVDKNKCLTVKFLRKLTKRQLHILYNTMMLADGHDPKNKRVNPVFTQNNNQTAHNFQILCVMLGKQCGWSKKSDSNGLSLTITKGRKRQIKRNIPTIKQYNGIVWCPTTESGTWIARRNGKVFITGNSYKAIPRFSETAVKRPWKIIKYGLLMAAVEEYTRRMYGESKEEVAREKHILPDYMQKSVLPGQLAHMRVPYRDKYNRSKYLDLSFILPWGDVAEQWGQSKFAGRPFLPSHPLWITIAEIGFNEVMFTGQELTIKDIDEGSEYWKKIGTQIWRQAAPSLAGSYSFNKLMAAIKGEKDWALRERSVPEAIFDVFLGLKIRSIDYTEERAKKLRYYRKKIDEINRQFSDDYVKIFIRNPTPDIDSDNKRFLNLLDKQDKQLQRIMDKITEIEE